MEGSPCRCQKWDATEDRMPPGPPTLRVKGTLLCPTPGYKVEVVRAQPQGINAADLVLDLRISPPSGPVAQVVTSAEFSYREAVKEGAYTTVTLRPVCGTQDVEIVR